MAGIIPIPTTRVGDLFVRQRLSSQVQADQLELFRLQNQVATGQRLQLPSEDAPAALRAINVQRLLSRKGQIRTNLDASAQYLAGADTRLSSISSSLTELRGSVVGVAGNTATSAARQAVAAEVDSLLKELVNAGNAQQQGRYLFAGSRSQTQPFDFTEGQFVEYLGNEGVLRSFVDIEQLFETNIPGTDVLGGVSAEVKGRIDLDAHLTADTLISTLSGGSGIGPNPTIEISSNDGISTERSVIDLRTAVTVGDIARLIEQNAPSIANIKVEIAGDHLVIRSDGDLISVGEVAEGHTARLLGILSDPDTLPTDSVTGLDINPAVLRTTALSNLVGTKSQGVIELGGPDNNIHIAAAANGSAFDGLTVVLQGGALAGSEVVNYDSGTNTLTVTLQDGVSTANQVAAAIEADGRFHAQADYHDSAATLQVGQGTISLGGASSLSFTNATSGGSGEPLDVDSGLLLTNGGQSVTLDISEAQTVEDLLNLINGANIGLTADINAAGTGINVRSRWSGADFTIGENGGSTATQLGIRTYNGATELSSLNRGIGLPTSTTLEQLDPAKLDDLRIVARDGAVLNVNLAGATTLHDVATLINSAPGNNTGTTSMVARLTGGGNRLELVDSSTAQTNPLRVEAISGSEAAEYLGFVPEGAAQQESTSLDSLGNSVLGGDQLLRNDLFIVARNGRQLSIDLAGASTVQDILDRINTNADNAPQVITARLARYGNGIELVDSSGGGGTLSVQVAEGSEAARYLGFVAQGASQSDPGDVRIEGANQVLQSEDRHTLEVDSVFNTLIRLRTALQTDDVVEIGRSLERLDAGMNRLTFARAEIGSRLQSLEAIGERLEDEDIQLRAALASDTEVDLVEAISQLTARQYAFEASLRSAGSLMQLSLLNFL